MLKAFKKTKQKIRKRLAARKLIKRYEGLLVVENIMEDWITNRILGGQKGRRKELLEKQKRIEEMQLFINYLKKVQ